MSDDVVERVTENHEYPDFNPAFVPVRVDDDTLHIRAGPWSGPIFTIRDVEHDRELTRLVDLLDGQTHVEDVLAAFDEDQRPEVARVLEGLYDQDVLFDRGERADDRSWPYMELKHSFHDKNRERLEAKDLLVVDAGGMGTMVAEDLLEMGVGEVQYLAPDDDSPPVGTLADHDRFRTVDADLETAVAAANFAVYTADDANTSLLDDLNRTAFEHDVPWVPAQIQGFDAIVGPAIYPGETPCYECFRDRKQSNVQNVEGYRAYERGLDERDDLSTLTTPAVERLVAGYLALDLTHLLAYGTGFTAGRVFTVDTLEMEMEANDVLKMPRCDVCGTSQGADYQRFITMDDVVEASDRMSDGGS